jgi:hypothetical protein
LAERVRFAAAYRPRFAGRSQVSPRLGSCAENRRLHRPRELQRPGAGGADGEALPDLQFLLVDSNGEGLIEALARGMPNIRMVPFQPPEALVQYVYVADILLIPSSLEPLAQFGSTVLPLKLFLYLGAGRPTLAGDTPDVREVLRHGQSAWLCPPDRVEALVTGLIRLTEHAGLAERLATAAQADSSELTWIARAARISDILTERLEAPGVVPSPWARVQGMRWRRLKHLWRSRFWVLPQEELIDDPHE